MGKVDPVRVAEVVAGVARALHPGRRFEDVGPGTSLDRDLALDSLGRVEVLGALERELGVRLPESVLGKAETVGDLIAAAGRAEGIPLPSPGKAATGVGGPSGVSVPLPTGARSLVEVFDFHAQRHPERITMTLYGDDDVPVEISYGTMHREAEEVAAALLEEGVKRGDRVALMLPTCREYFPSFMGILMAGAVPVPIYPPARISQIEDHLRRQAAILANAGVPVLVTVPEARSLAGFLEARVPTLRRVVAPSELRGRGRLGARPGVGPGDLAFLQYTSGSTGSPKGVMLGHDNLLANVRELGRGLAATPERDVFVSWLPLYHDLGLIGAWMATHYHAVPLVLMSPLKFLARPARWLEAISRHRGTLSAGPNFAYELCVRRVSDEELAPLDLASWRVAINGAEPVSPGTLRRFAARFGPKGFPASAAFPCYGLAENCLGVCYSPLGREPRILKVVRSELARNGRVEPAGEGAGDDAIELVGCGYPLPHHEVSVVDAAGREVEERVEGRVLFKGPSATRGYFENPEATAKLVVGEWRDSGDRGFLADGEIFLTGRAKDIIIKAGRNIYPQELEDAVGDLPGVRKGCVAVFGSPDPVSGTERVVVMAEVKEAGEAERAAILAAVQEAASRVLGEPADDVALVPPQTVPKTSSGKLRRSSARELYERGAMRPGGRPVWMQLATLGLASGVSRIRGAVRGLAEWAWAAWFWGMFFAIVVPTWFVLAVLPGSGVAVGVGRAATRLFLWVCGIGFDVRGIEGLRGAGPAVVVVNHQSYLDAVALLAASPGALAPVVKGEMKASFVARTFFRGLGALFLERFDRQRAVEDLRSISAAAAAGRGVVFFPEGTFRRAVGLLPFHLGAFAVACELGLPVVPVALRGTRRVLRPDQWYPRRGPVEVEVGPAMAPAGKDLAAQAELRDRARAWILAHCGEPDAGLGAPIRPE